MDIIPRKIMHHPKADSPKYWFAEKGFETLFFNALSSTFPEGERFFIQSVRNYAEHISDAELRANVDRFVSQEGQHSQQHEGHVALLADQGFGLLVSMNRWERAVMRWLVTKMPRFALAVTLTIEHVTAIFASALLADQKRFCEPMHDDYRLLWHWHSVEEIEHKAVAFDVYQQTGGGYGLRLLAAVEVAVFFPVLLFFRHVLLLAKDGLLLDLGEWRRGGAFLLGRNGLLRVIAGEYGRCLHRDFHPLKRDDSHHIEEFNRLYAAQFQLL